MVDPDQMSVELVLSAPSLHTVRVRVDEDGEEDNFRSQDRVVRPLRALPSLHTLDITFVPIEAADWESFLPEATALKALCVHWTDLELLPLLPPTLRHLTITAASGPDDPETLGINAADLVTALMRADFPELETLVLERATGDQAEAGASRWTLLPADLESLCATRRTVIGLMAEADEDQVLPRSSEIIKVKNGFGKRGF